MATEPTRPTSPPHEFSAAEIGALAHFYRGEIYRSMIWRTRLDNTTNWAVVALGSPSRSAFSSPQASPLPPVLVGVLIVVFLSSRRGATATSMSGGRGRDGWRRTFTPPCFAGGREFWQRLAPDPGERLL